MSCYRCVVRRTCVLNCRARVPAARRRPVGIFKLRAPSPICRRSLNNIAGAPSTRPKVIGVVLFTISWYFVKKKWEKRICWNVFCCKIFFYRKEAWIYHSFNILYFDFATIISRRTTFRKTFSFAEWMWKLSHNLSMLHGTWKSLAIIVLSHQ